MSFTVAPVAVDEYEAAARLLFAHDHAAEDSCNAARCRDLLAFGELNAEGLFAARDASNRLRGVMLVQPLLGGLGLAWPPRVARTPDQHALEDQLVATACAWLRNRGVKVCQAFTADRDRLAMSPLERAGFRHITQVLHFRRPLDAQSTELLPPHSLGFRVYSPALHKRFQHTLLSTYEGSRDCPELNGSRSPDELLEAFGNSGIARWFLVEADTTPIGVVLCDVGSEAGSIELAYLGLVPAARGRGFGDHLIRFVIREARSSGATTLTLSVDARNDPAVRLYRRHGFEDHDQHDVHLAVWSDSDLAKIA